MNVGDIKRRVLAVLGDDAKLIFTDANLIDMINDAQVDICRKAGVIVEPTILNFIAGVHGGYLLPTNCIEIYRVTIQGKKIYQSTWQEIDHIDPDRDTGASLGVPTHYYTIGNQIFFYPESTKAYAFGEVEITYSRTPFVLTSDTEEPELPDAFHEDICVRVIAKGHEQLEDFQASQVKIAEYNSSISYTVEQSRDVNDESYPYIRDIDYA